jgi:putative transcriptional regulator
LTINNRRIIPLNWFRQIADSKFANSLKEIAKIAKSDLEQLLYEATIYQEFFELQILVKDESIQ